MVAVVAAAGHRGDAAGFAARAGGLVFGDDAGLVVETAPGAGTRVSFRVPKYAPRAADR